MFGIWFGFEFVVWLLIFGVAGDMLDCVWIWYCCCNMSLRRVSGLLFWWFGFLVAVGFMFACIGGLCRFGFVFWLFGFGRRLVAALWQVVGGVVSVCRCLLLVGWRLWCLDSRLRIGCLWISVGFGGLWGLFCGWLVT